MSAPYVRTSDCIEQMEVLTADGVRLTVAPISDEALEALAGEAGRRGEIYRGIKRIREQYGGLIRQRYSDITARGLGLQPG
jgi:uncharacterized protein with gpF-like domain